MHPEPRTALRVFALLAVALSFAAFSARAREGFYLGAGYATVSASGDLKGKAVVNTSGTEAVVLGKLGSGSGAALEIGYGFNAYLGLEYLFTQTSHTATADPSLIDPTTLAPIRSTTAAVSLGVIGLRLTAPVAKSFEIFARAGPAAAIVKYPDYSFTSSGGKGDFTLTGGGTGYGAGFEVLGDHLGFELAYTAFNISFDTVQGSSTSGKLLKSRSESFSQGTAIVAYHF